MPYDVRMKITLANSSSELHRAYPVMVQLRPHLSAADFLAQVQRQQQFGYQLALLEYQQQIAAAAGFRISEYLAWGRAMYVDDLVTDSAQRSAGFGRQLFDWLVSHAREQGCKQLHLDSGVQRFDAHRFYLTRRMRISSHHFMMEL
ncbi:MAG: hypothetical protein HJJLKODD_01971 [Phycisphaerae bacterium]|nr:hypothetical protein [Phycisphaerae bacterium]